jgi:hypothetical protein
MHTCVDLLALEQSKQIRGYVIIFGFESNVGVGIGLVDMYAKYRNVNISHKLFKIMPNQIVVSWNAFIVVYSQIGHPMNP